MKVLKPILLAAAVSLITGPVSGHDTKGSHGGRVVDAGNYHLELVVGGSDIEVFVSDGGAKPVATTGFKAVAILNADGKVQRIALEAGDPTKLSGKAAIALPAYVKGIVQLTAPDGTVRQGQFK